MDIIFEAKEVAPNELTTIQKIRSIYSSALWKHLDMMYVEAGLKDGIMQCERDNEYVQKIILDAMLKTIDRYIKEKVFLR